MPSLQLQAGWELDFLGKNRAELAAALGRARVAELDHHAARVLLASNVTRAYLHWAHWLARREVDERALAQRHEMLALVRQRVHSGLDNQLELHHNEVSRADIQAGLVALEQQAAASRHALAALVGLPHLPEGVAPPRLDQFNPLAVPTELTADWLGQRADIMAAAWRVEAARGEVQLARTRFYPNINLASFVGFQSLGLGSLLESGSAHWGVGPAISLPLFEGGRLRAQLIEKSADKDMAIENYNATVIDALQGVADQSQAVRAVAQQQSEQTAALQAAEDAYDIARQRYAAGLATYLQVLAAETAVLTQRRLQIDLRFHALLGQVNLAQAMGGGWQPTPEQALPADQSTFTAGSRSAYLVHLKKGL